MQSKNTYKVVIIGDGGVGKTTLLRRLCGLEFDQKYLATIGVEVYPVKFCVEKEDTKQEICLNMWDCAGQNIYRGLASGYYIGANLAIIIVAEDGYVHNTMTAQITKWTTEFRRVQPDAAILVLQSKYTWINFDVHNTFSNIIDFNADRILGKIAEVLNIQGKVKSVPILAPQNLPLGNENKILTDEMILNYPSEIPNDGKENELKLAYEHLTSFEKSLGFVRNHLDELTLVRKQLEKCESEKTALVERAESAERQLKELKEKIQVLLA